MELAVKNNKLMNQNTVFWTKAKILQARFARIRLGKLQQDCATTVVRRVLRLQKDCGKLRQS